MSTLKTPILPGSAATDYERYLRTDELLSLQKPAADVAHRDELLFQVIHQSSELWLKLACVEIDEAIARLDRDDVWGAARLLRRSVGALDQINAATSMLLHISPFDYHAMRPALGHGSGFDSPGFRRTHDVSPRLHASFTGLLARRQVDVATVYRQSSQHEDLFQVAELLLDWDERLILWRTIHLKAVERVIGGHVIGTQGTPVEVLGRRIDVRYFPELWDVRNDLTRAASGQS